jgi:hypothetical protein
VRRVLLVVLPILLLVGGFLGYGMYRESVLYVSTDRRGLVYLGVCHLPEWVRNRYIVGATANVCWRYEP